MKIYEDSRGWRYRVMRGNPSLPQFDDWYDTSHERYDDLVATKPLVLGVFRIDAHGSVAHDCLWASSGYDCVVTAFGILMEHFTFFASRLYRVGVSVCHIVAEMEEVALFISVDDFFGREHSLSLWIPVDHAESAIDESLLVEVDKDFEDALAAFLVHGESCTVPVA